ncbi:Uncharacterised protein [Mycobacteroides abscessus subsp. abscessus]|nr:Uncharacterised protein [Mycobacteroides abscessus subsp. abscessus]
MQFTSSGLGVAAGGAAADSEASGVSEAAAVSGSSPLVRR